MEFLSEANVSPKDTNMDSPLESAIATLQRQLQEKERMANEIYGQIIAVRESINLLRSQAGLSPLFPDDGGGSGTRPGAGTETLSTSTGQAGQINSDAFYGKRQATAIREYLEMRRAAGLGPAKPREIYDALRQGGYQFKAKEDETALVGMRALLRKMNSTFHKVPGTSAYGLRSWYPHAGTVRPSTAGADGETAPPDDGNKSEREHNSDESEAAASAA
jgi:hypothetical protein